MLDGMTRTLLAALAGLAATAADLPAQSFRRNQPARVVLEARAPAPITSAPQTVDIVLSATPLPGIHVYAPGNADYIPVSVTIFPVEGLAAGTPVFPRAEPYFFAPLRQSVKVYSRPFVIRVPLKVLPAFAKSREPGPSEVAITGQVDYQSCDDKVCFPPQSVPFAVKVPVKLGRESPRR